MTAAKDMQLPAAELEDFDQRPSRQLRHALAPATTGISERFIPLLLLLLGFGSHALRAEPPARLDVADLSPPTFRVFTINDGLSDEIWSTVGFDGDGYVWGGSASSLARFDGYRWTTWSFTPRSLVRDMATSPDGTLWAIFEGDGLARYDGRRWQLDPAIEGFIHRFSTVDRADGGGRDLWAAAASGLYVWQDGRWRPDSGNAGLPPGQPVRIEATEQLLGRPLQWTVGTVGGLWFREMSGPDLHWQKLDLPEFATLLPTDLVRTVDRGQEELWLVSYNTGLFRLREDGLRVWREATGELPTEALYTAVATYAPDGERSLWIASRAGLLRIRGDEVSTYDRRHGLPSDAVRSLKLDRSPDGIDLLWIATEGGIARAALTESQWQTVSLLGARENGIFGLLLEPDDQGGERLWIGSAMQGLGLLQDGHWRYFRHSEGRLPARGVRAIWRFGAFDSGPLRLVSLSDGQLLQIEETDQGFDFLPWRVPWAHAAEQVANDALFRRAAAGDELWFGNAGVGIHRHQAGRWQQFLAEGARWPWTVIKLAEQIDAQGRSWLWAATDQGLARHDGDRWKMLDSALGLPADGFRSVSITADEERTLLWAGSFRHGVLRLDVTDPLAPQLLAADGLPPAPDPTTYSVLSDSKGRIYICTNNGVQQLTPDASGGYRSRVYTRRDGMVHDECNTNGQFIDAHDRYWVGTLAGLSVFDPDTQPPAGQARSGPLRLTELRVDGSSLPASVDGRFELPAGSRELRLSFSLFSAMREDESLYRSQLQGYDPEFSQWTDEYTRNYTGLSPGDYRFVVEARDYAGVAGEPMVVPLNVHPYWWQRPLVQVAFVGLFLLALVALVQLYSRNLRLRQHQLSLLVAERTAELHSANERLTELSYQDPLTGVANRRRLIDAIDAEIERATLRAQPIGLIVVDVDNFKDYNDRHGHLAGDTALRAVANALASATRAQDLIARFGGEEFACLMIDADIDAVARVAERMRALVEALPPRALGNDVSTITLSAGISSRVPTSGESAAEFLQEADAALFIAKRQGRNCVVRAGSR